MEYLNNGTIHNNHRNSTLLYIVDIGAAFGILLNLVALAFILFGNKVKSGKQKLLFTILSLNNGAALISLLCAQLLNQLSPTGNKRYFCVLHVLARMFGINGGCTDIVIAIDRFFAISNPISYSHRITTSTIRRLLCTILLLASLFTLAPLMGLGAYYSTETETCTTYVDHTNVLDYAYGIAFVIFGFSICITLVVCNIGVITTLSKYRLSSPYNKCKNEKKEELVFSKIIVTVSILYIICWLPHLITSALYLLLEDVKSLLHFQKIAHLLLLLNFILSPIIQIFMLK